MSENKDTNINQNEEVEDTSEMEGQDTSSDDLDLDDVDLDLSDEQQSDDDQDAESEQTDDDNHEAFAELNKKYRDAKNKIKELESKINDNSKKSENTDDVDNDLRKQVADLQNQIESDKKMRAQKEAAKELSDQFELVLKQLKEENPEFTNEQIKKIARDKNFRHSTFVALTSNQLNDAEKSNRIISAVKKIDLNLNQTTQTKPEVKVEKTGNPDIDAETAWFNQVVNQKGFRYKDLSDYNKKHEDFITRWKNKNL